MLAMGIGKESLSTMDEPESPELGGQEHESDIERIDGLSISTPIVWSVGSLLDCVVLG